MKDYTTTVTLLESIQDGILICNAAGSIEYANQSALRYLGVKLADVLGKTMDDYLQGIKHPTLKAGQSVSGSLYPTPNSVRKLIRDPLSSK